MEGQELEFCLASESDYDQVMSISQGVYRGLDYLPTRYHQWLQDPWRLVLLAKRDGRVIALESVLVIEGEQTGLLQALRVAEGERGRGIATKLQRYLMQLVRSQHPNLKTIREVRINEFHPEKVLPFTLVTIQGVLCFRLPAAQTRASLTDLLRRQVEEGGGEGGWGPVTLGETELRDLLLSPSVIEDLLPNRTVIREWDPYRPLASNLPSLLGGGSVWMADSKQHPRVFSVSIPTYPIPLAPQHFRFDINLFGRSLEGLKRQMLGQILGMLPPEGTVILQVFADRSLIDGLYSFWEGEVGFERYQVGINQQVVLELIL